MTKFLVPVDFTRAAINAAEYAIQMANCLDKATLVLFSVQSPTGIGADGSPVSEEDVNRAVAMEQMLETLQVQLFELAPVPIEIRSGYGEFIPELQKLLLNEKFDFVVMGIASASAIEETLIGSSTVDFAQNNEVPVVIVGEQMRFHPIQKVAVAIELNNIEKLIATEQIQDICNRFGASLHFVHVSNNANLVLTEEQQQEKQKLENIFKANAPQFHQIHMVEFVDAINTFVYQEGVNLLLVQPRRHNLWQRLFNTNHTRQLAFHSVAPLMAVHNL